MLRQEPINLPDPTFMCSALLIICISASRFLRCIPAEKERFYAACQERIGHTNLLEGIRRRGLTEKERISADCIRDLKNGMKAEEGMMTPFDLNETDGVSL